MSKTRRSLVIVFLIQLLMVIGLGAFFETLKEVISHNPVVNSLILTVLIGSIIYSFIAALLVFRGESKWIGVSVNGHSASAIAKVHAQFPDIAHAEAAHRDVAVESLNESLEWRGRMLDYASGVLIGLGLLGTFVGLMHTMAGIKDAMALVSGAGGKASASALIGGLTAPLAGMSTAFSASLLGLIGSLAVGALAQFLNRASSNWIESIREWANEIAVDSNIENPSAVNSSNEVIARIEHAVAGMQAHIGQLVKAFSAGQEKQLALAASSSASLDRIAALAERQDTLLAVIQRNTQVNTAALQSAREAVIAMAGSVEANRTHVTSAIGSLSDAVIDIKTNTEQTVVRLDTVQNGLTAKHAVVEKMGVSVQMQGAAVMSCVEQIARARVAIESNRAASADKVSFDSVSLIEAA